VEGSGAAEGDDRMRHGKLTRNTRRDDIERRAAPAEHGDWPAAPVKALAVCASSTRLQERRRGPRPSNQEDHVRESGSLIQTFR
jgi:hypothetical protein